MTMPQLRSVLNVTRLLANIAKPFSYCLRNFDVTLCRCQTVGQHRICAPAVVTYSSFSKQMRREHVILRVGSDIYVLQTMKSCDVIVDGGALAIVYTDKTDLFVLTDVDHDLRKSWQRLNTSAALQRSTPLPKLLLRLPWRWDGLK